MEAELLSVQQVKCPLHLSAKKNNTLKKTLLKVQTVEQKQHTEMSKDPLEHSEATQGDQRRQTVQFEDTLRVGTLDSLSAV